MQLDLNTGNIDLVCVNDNASNMKLGIKLTRGLDQYFCDIHTLELGVGDTFKKVEGMTNVLKKPKALAQFTNQSSVTLDELKKEAAKEKIPFRKLKNPPNKMHAPPGTQPYFSGLDFFYKDGLYWVWIPS